MVAQDITLQVFEQRVAGSILLPHIVDVSIELMLEKFHIGLRHLLCEEIFIEQAETKNNVNDTDSRSVLRHVTWQLTTSVSSCCNTVVHRWVGGGDWRTGVYLGQPCVLYNLTHSYYNIQVAHTF